MSARSAPPPPGAPRFLTEAQKEWLKNLRQVCCPGTERWNEQLYDIRDANGYFPDDYWHYVSYLNDWWKGTLPCNGQDSGMTPKGPGGGATRPEPVRPGTGPQMPPAFSDWPSPREVIPQKPYFASSTSSARLRGVLLAGQAQRRKAAATGLTPLMDRYLAFYVAPMPGSGEEKVKVTSVDVSLRTEITGKGNKDFKLIMQDESFEEIKETLEKILHPGGKLTRHTLVFIGNVGSKPTSNTIVATRSSIKADWDILEMATTIKTYYETYAKDPAKDKTLRIQVQCPCPTKA